MQEIAATSRRNALDAENRARPTHQLVGFIQGRNDPLLKGIFKKGDEIDFFTVGIELSPNWKLVAFNDDEAQFQNTKFDELKFSIKVQGSTSTSGRATSRATENLF
jgi:hypothetical protein